MSYATRAGTRVTPSSSPRAGQPPCPPPGGSGGGDSDNPLGGGGGDPPGPPPGAVGGHPVPVFALTPARPVSGFIDYTSRHRQRLYESATAKLSIEFDCNSASLSDFVGMANKRAIECNWKMTTLIKVNGVQHDLFDQYGFLTTEQIRAHIKLATRKMPSRWQNALTRICMYTCNHTQG